MSRKRENRQRTARAGTGEVCMQDRADKIANEILAIIANALRDWLRVIQADALAQAAPQIAELLRSEFADVARFAREHDALD
jgi:hypothetical protein